MGPQNMHLSYIAERANRNKKIRNWTARLKRWPQPPWHEPSILPSFPKHASSKFALLEFHPTVDWFWIFFHSISTSFHSLTQSLHCYCSCAFILVWRFSSKNCAIYFVQPRIVRGCCQTPLTMPNCTPWCCLRPCSWTLLESDGCCLRWGATGCTESICTKLSQTMRGRRLLFLRRCGGAQNILCPTGSNVCCICLHLALCKIICTLASRTPT